MKYAPGARSGAARSGRCWRGADARRQAGMARPTASARGRKPLPRRRAQDLGIAFDGQALRFGDTLNQKDQAIHACRQCPNAIGKLIGAIFKPSHPGFKCSKPVIQSCFQRDHPAIQTGNVVLQAVQSPSDGSRVAVSLISRVLRSDHRSVSSAWPGPDAVGIAFRRPGIVAGPPRRTALDPCFERTTPSVSRHVTASRRCFSFQLRLHDPPTSPPVHRTG